MFVHIGTVILAGLAAGALTSRIGLPAVTGYLVVGILLGPSLMGALDSEVLARRHLIEHMALGFIAFTIGQEFLWEQVGATASRLVGITLLQALFSAAFITASIYLLTNCKTLALLFGVIGTATAAGETLMVIKEMRSSGPLTRTALGVVALGDAVVILSYSFVVSLLTVMAANQTIVFPEFLKAPLREIGLSAVLGALTGIVLSHLFAYARNHGQVLSFALITVILATGLAELWALSPLLTNLSAGAALANTSGDRLIILADMDDVLNPVYITFFVVTGASLQVDALPQIGFLGAAYVAARSLGKFAGSGLGAHFIGADSAVKKYLGLTLLPQAGVALGLAGIVGQEFAEHAEVLYNVILASTLLFSVGGAALTQFALTRAGEANKA